MKTKLIILALAVTCLGADSLPLPTTGTVTASGNYTGFLTGNLTTSDIIVFEKPESKEIFRVKGLAIISLGSRIAFGGTRYEAPDKPDEVQAILVTKDGKRWRAQWVEDKP